VQLFRGELYLPPGGGFFVGTTTAGEGTTFLGALWMATFSDIFYCIAGYFRSLKMNRKLDSVEDCYGNAVVCDADGGMTNPPHRSASLLMKYGPGGGLAFSLGRAFSPAPPP